MKRMRFNKLTKKAEQRKVQICAEIIDKWWNAAAVQMLQTFEAIFFALRAVQNCFFVSCVRVMQRIFGSLTEASADDSRQRLVCEITRNLGKFHA